MAVNNTKQGVFRHHLCKGFRLPDIRRLSDGGQGVLHDLDVSPTSNSPAYTTAINMIRFAHDSRLTTHDHYQSYLWRAAHSLTYLLIELVVRGGQGNRVKAIIRLGTSGTRDEQHAQTQVGQDGWDGELSGFMFIENWIITYGQKFLQGVTEQCRSRHWKMTSLNVIRATNRLCLREVLCNFQQMPPSSDRAVYNLFNPNHPDQKHNHGKVVEVEMLSKKRNSLSIFRIKEVAQFVIVSSRPVIVQR
ncbi:hypothetical protein RRG08_030166 [Elysia crispata]|uniref:Uncharacterized protein n=1 Tax=Elysia crispata TaxID=231223 RepID=A0AAE0ZR66_9GAST|nr:hypothetical protein RRG08_030166 [Elysia crispata]